MRLGPGATAAGKQTQYADGKCRWQTSRFSHLNFPLPGVIPAGLDYHAPAVICLADFIVVELSPS
ncbi:hypothetical protein SBA4_7130002 [Candidatus Sulfopaludibacter sp. SbA4]|nr:hypothetical protein SBA4_7130002 [Candidatus Sulfopaludibacter sp. SbA4]